jgi:hypothetical protein
VVILLILRWIDIVERGSVVVLTAAASRLSDPLVNSSVGP